MAILCPWALLTRQHLLRRGHTQIGLERASLQHHSPKSSHGNQDAHVQEIDKGIAPGSLPEELPASENGASSPLPGGLGKEPAKELHDGASTPESGEISEPEAPAKEVTGPEEALPPPPTANGHPVAATSSPKRKHEAERSALPWIWAAYIHGFHR